LLNPNTLFVLGSSDFEVLGLEGSSSS